MSRILLIGMWLTVMRAGGLAQAQPAPSFEALAGSLDGHPRVLVTDRSGEDIRGEVAEVTPSAIALRINDFAGLGQTRTIPRRDVVAIRRSDRLRNGFLIGLAAGYGAKEIWSYHLCGAPSNDRECRAITTAIGLVTFVPAGAVIGALVDKAIGNQVLYRSPAGGTVSLRVRPDIGVGRGALTARLRF